MKLLVLHLSDAHFHSKASMFARIDKLVISLGIVKKVDECVIMFSGDIANEGTANNYISY